MHTMVVVVVVVVSVVVLIDADVCHTDEYATICW